MNKKRIAFRMGLCPMVLCMIGLFCCVGCVRSIQPLLKDDQVTVDEDLVGQWVNSESEFGATIRLDEQGLYYHVILQGKKEEDQLLLTGKLGRIKDHLFFEVTPDLKSTDVDNSMEIYLVPVYQFFLLEKKAPGQVAVRLMDPDWLAKYLKDHPDELQIQKVGNKEENKVITSSTDQYQAFVLKHLNDPGAMTDAKIFVHPGDPTTQPAATQPSSTPAAGH